MLFQEILLGFFVYENLLGRCDLKIAVVEFVYPFLFLRNCIILWAKLFFPDFYPVSHNISKCGKLAIKVLAKSTKCENNIFSLVLP